MHTIGNIVQNMDENLQNISKQLRKSRKPMSRPEYIMNGQAFENRSANIIKNVNRIRRHVNKYSAQMQK